MSELPRALARSAWTPGCARRSRRATNVWMPRSMPIGSSGPVRLLAFRLREFARDGDPPAAAACVRDRDLTELGGLGKRPVGAELDVPDAGERDSAVALSELDDAGSVAVLGPRERTETAPTLELGEAGSLSGSDATVERLEGAIEPPQHAVLSERMHAHQPGQLMPGLGELFRLFAERDRDAVGPPGPDALLERSVVEVAARRRAGARARAPASCRVEPVLPRAMHPLRARYARPPTTTTTDTRT